MNIARWMARGPGRLGRIAIGVALVVVGIVVGDGLGLMLILVGLVPIAAGVFNSCLIAPILRAPFWGRDAQSRHVYR